MLTVVSSPTVCGRPVPSARPAPGANWQSLPIRIDMGGAPKAEGAFYCDGDYRAGAFAWIRGMVKNGLRTSERDPWLCDFVAGHDATFVIGVRPAAGTYQLRVTLGDADEPRGPVRITAGGRVVAAAVSTTAGRPKTIDFPLTTKNGHLELRFQAPGCAGFAVIGVELSGPPGATIENLYPPTPAATASHPPAAALPRLDSAARRLLLGRLCDHLIETAPAEGCFSFHGAWYENAYPIRCLLAGARLLNRPAYAQAAYACLDRFLARQSRDGNWLAAYSGPARCDGISAPDSSSANLADVGLMTLGLVSAALDADPARRERYENAAKLYAEKVALPNQLADGSFPNRRWGGTDSRHSYTVATATQCASLSALYQLGHDARYLKSAESAAYWLTRHSIREDGRFTLYPHDRPEPIVGESTRFGDIFYVAEALIWARRVTRDAALHKEIDQTLDRWLFAPQGARSRTVNGTMWPSQDAWSDSKMAGMLYVLARVPRGPHAAELSAWTHRMVGWLAEPRRARTIGVLAEQGSPEGLYALTATGYAGLGVAATLDSVGVR